MTKHLEIAKFRGSEVANVAEMPGIYSWYYVPDVPPTAISQKVRPVLESFIVEARRAELTIFDSYRTNLVGRTEVRREPTGREKSLSDILMNLMSNSLVQERLVSKEFVTTFCRPIYVGISRRPLRSRLFNEHILTLDELWDESSPVSRFLSARNQGVAVDDVAESLGIGHSFALDARVRGIRTRDLLAHVMYLSTDYIKAVGPDDPTDASTDTSLRDLERLLHLLSFPVCGRL